MKTLAWTRLESLSALVLVASAGLPGCGDDDAPAHDDDDAGVSACNAQIPSAWDGSDFDTNAAIELALRGRLQALNERMTQAEAETELPAQTRSEDLLALFDDGDPSLRDAMTSAYASVSDHIFDLFVAAVGVTLDPEVTWAPTPAASDTGGRLCGPSACWIMSAGGADLRQVFEKGAYQAVMYNRAQQLAAGTVTPATIDRIAALFGANAALDVDGSNVHAANYAKGIGFYGTIRGHLIAAKAYAQAGSRCADELQDELSEFFEAWEQSQMARFVYYANRAHIRFGTPGTTEEEHAEALHWLGEGLGLVYGFQGLPSGSKLITDAQLDQVLTLMKMPSISTAQVYAFRAGESADLDDIAEVFDLVQEIYGFSDEQMNAQIRVHPTTPG
jgi:hypothetical protein